MRMLRWVLPVTLTSCLLFAACGGGGADTESSGEAGETGTTEGGASAAGGGKGDGGASVGMGAGVGASVGVGGTGLQPPECDETGRGTIIVEVTGLPGGVVPIIDFEGPDESPSGVGSFGAVLAGGYVISMPYVTQSDPLVRGVYAATMAQQAFCLGENEIKNITVDYALVPSSNKLWAPSDTDEELAGFESAALTANGTTLASVSIDGPGSKDIAFDKVGNLWAMGPTVADPHLVRFAAAELGESATLEPDIALNVADIACIPALRSMAFDPNGNLWISVCSGQVLRLEAADIAASGDITAGGGLLGLTETNQGIAFDRDGNLWVADAVTVSRFDAARLAGEDSDGADRALSVRDLSDTFDFRPEKLAFDQAGNLWVTDLTAATIFQVAAADLEGTGAETVIANTNIELDILAIVDGIAFDEANGLWFGLTNGTVARLHPSQLGLSSSPGMPFEPERIITSASLGDAGNVAFYPAPAGLPLYHAIP